MCLWIPLTVFLVHFIFIRWHTAAVIFDYYNPPFDCLTDNSLFGISLSISLFLWFNYTWFSIHLISLSPSLSLPLSVPFFLPVSFFLFLPSLVCLSLFITLSLSLSLSLSVYLSIYLSIYLFIALSHSLSISLSLSLSLLLSESNLCYGEGGAGTWSDGKLTTSIGIVSQILFFMSTNQIHSFPVNLMTFRAHLLLRQLLADISHIKNYSYLSPSSL